MPGQPPPEVDQGDEATIEKFRRYIETNYSPIPKDEQERLLESISTLIEMGHNKKDSLKSVMEYVSNLIFKFFDFHEIAIGLKSRKDAIYRYEVLFGYRKELQDKFAQMKYTYEDMVEYDRFPNIKMGRRSEINFFEKVPETEKALFARPY